MLILKTHNYYQDNLWNKSDFTYTFETGTKIEFFSADQPSKLRGSRRDILFINEANNVPFEAYSELEIRTKLFVMIDFNPVAEFYAHTKLMQGEDYEFIKLTYKDNEALDPRIVKAIEAKKETNPKWWLTYGLGEIGTNEGQIFTNWEIIDRVPEEARLEGYGLDFGYTNDPTALISAWKYDNGYILKEELYQPGLSNKEIADYILKLPKALVTADSSEPKSIDEIRRLGVNITGAEKGQGSVNYGIQYLQDQKISVTKESLNLIKEMRNYLWKYSKNGDALNVPIDDFNHACFVKNTIVDGSLIQNIGFKTGVHKVYDYLIAGKHIRATKNHPILTSKGFVAIDALRYNDIIWNNKLFMTVSGSTGLKILIIGVIGCTTNALKRLFQVKKRDCIDTSGKNILGKYQQSTKYTIKILIPSIMTLIISSVLSLASTLNFIGTNKKKNAQLLVEKILKRLVKQHQNGAKHQKVLQKESKWVKTTPTLCGLSLKKDCAICANWNILLNQSTLDFATKIAELKHYAGVEETYNLKTSSGMYRAEGILVSNCDAVRYCIVKKQTYNDFDFV